MPEVALKIGPRTYTVTCGPGEEERIAALGAIVAEKYAALGNARAPLEAQNLLFAALFLADELNEARAAPENSAAPDEAPDQRVEEELARLRRELKAEFGKERAAWDALKADLKAENETLRRAEERAREDVAKQSLELAELREQLAKNGDLFAEADSLIGRPSEDAIVETLEALAARAEATAEALEGALPDAEGDA